MFTTGVPLICLQCDFMPHLEELGNFIPLGKMAFHMAQRNLSSLKPMPFPSTAQTEASVSFHLLHLHFDTQIDRSCSLHKATNYILYLVSEPQKLWFQKKCFRKKVRKHGAAELKQAPLTTRAGRGYRNTGRQNTCDHMHSNSC